MFDLDASSHSSPLWNSGSATRAAKRSVNSAGVDELQQVRAHSLSIFFLNWPSFFTASILTFHAHFSALFGTTLQHHQRWCPMLFASAAIVVASRIDFFQHLVCDLFNVIGLAKWTCLSHKQNFCHVKSAYGTLRYWGLWPKAHPNPVKSCECWFLVCYMKRRKVGGGWEGAHCANWNGCFKEKWDPAALLCAAQILTPSWEGFQFPAEQSEIH